MTTAKLPWRINSYNPCIAMNNDGVIARTDDDCSNDAETDSANAALIVRAVNSHENLLKALEAADQAINPSDRNGISLEVWNMRLKAATSIIRTTLAEVRALNGAPHE